MTFDYLDLDKDSLTELDKFSQKFKEMRMTFDYLDLDRDGMGGLEGVEGEGRLNLGRPKLVHHSPLRFGLVHPLGWKFMSCSL